MSILDNLTFEQMYAPSPVPAQDIAICSECNWRGPIVECSIGEDGDWETGYYPVPECPICEDGGSIDDFDMSPVRYMEWLAWYMDDRQRRKVEHR